MSNTTTGNPFITVKAGPKKKKKYVNHRMNKDTKCEHKTYFNVTQALILTLQKTTGKMTHEIMGTLVEMYEKMIKDYELDLSNKTTGGSFHRGREWCTKEIRKKRTTTFPGTEIYLSCNLGITYQPTKYDERNNRWSTKRPDEKMHCDNNTLLVTANFFMPRRSLTFTQEQVGEMMLEGEIFDCSEDIAELQSNDSLTPATIRARAKVKADAAALKKQERELLKQQKAIAKAEAKLKKLKTDSMKP